MIFNQFSSNLKKELYKIDNTNKVFNYINLLSNLDNSLCNISKDSLITIFEAIDKSYSNSIEDHISNKCTKFITFSSHFYSEDGLENIVQLFITKTNNIKLT